MQLQSPAKVLLVEDHDDTRRVMERLLRHHGYVVHACADSAEALSFAATVPCDVALIDIGLPDVDGTELFQRLRAIRPTPAIAFTAHVMANDMATYRALGFDDIVIKPVSPGHLIAAIRRLMAPSSGAADAEDEGAAATSS